MEFHNPGFIIEVQNFINYNGLGATWGEILSAKQFFLVFTARRPSCSGCNLPTHSAVRGIPGPPLLKTHHVYLSAANKCVEQVLLGPRGKPPSMERSALKLDIYPKKQDPRVICFAAALWYLFVLETFSYNFPGSKAPHKLHKKQMCSYTVFQEQNIKRTI